VAKDVCNVLELNDVSKACERLDDDEKGTNTILTLGGNQEMVTVSESGLYSLVLTSRKPEAKAFKKWLTSVVLPSIRKTGGYSVPQVEQTKLPQNYLEALKALVAAEEEKQLLLADNQVMAAKIDLDAPLVAYANAVQYTEDSIDFNAFAKMLGTGRTRLFRQMREAGVILKDSTLPYQKWVDAGYFEVSQTIETVEGKLIPFALVTGKGQLWLHQRLQKIEFLSKKESFEKQLRIPFGE